MNAYQETEVKFLNIDPKEIEEKLKKLGAKKEFEKLYRRRVFDYPDRRLDNQGAWLRLRDEGNQTTLTFKRRLGIQGHRGETNDSGMEEIEVVVDNFDKTADLLKRIGFTEKFYTENKRLRYSLNEIEFDIDSWPLIPPYLEIEAKGWAKVDEGIEFLGLNPNDKKIFSANQVYALNGITESDYQILTFTEQRKRTLT